MEKNKNLDSHTTIIVQKNASNGLGTAGFILALLGLIFCWVPIFNFIVWFLGLVLSFFGVFKKPRELAIAGLVISIIGLIVMVGVLGTMGILAAFSNV